MKLTAGELSLHYENGFLRWITTGENEVLRMVYFAVRDKEWNTVPGKILNQKIERTKKNFSISYEMLFEKDDISLQWDATIKGSSDNRIVFDIKGKALSTFKKNRTGFCVLHPIKECEGNNILIQHKNGTLEENIFPISISPQQPFKNIEAMQWCLDDNSKITVTFEGDIFETEDHRNWTDNNYKTYCTPLEIPFPVTINKGDEIHQSISIKFDGLIAKKENKNYVEIFVEDDKLPIPAIGVGRASERDETYHEALKILSSAGFSHYRVDLKLRKPDWQQTIKNCFEEAELMKTKLEIALFVNAGIINKIPAFINLIKGRKDIQQIILLEEDKKCIADNLLNELLNRLRPQLPGILIGAGTDIYFAELNRSHLDTTGIDFVSYSINPQVHAFDDDSIMENASAQGATVLSAKQKFNKAVHISPITLRKRYNAEAAGLDSTALPLADKRQSAGINAVWALASLKSLIENGASSITYFETIGKRGLGIYDSLKGMNIFPVTRVLNVVLAGQPLLLKSRCSNPSVIVSLVLVYDNRLEILIGNKTKKIQKVQRVITGKVKAADLITGHAINIEGADGGAIGIELRAYQIIILTQLNLQSL
ncbi:MAG: hypothetical protein ABI707_05105 [Ferruginibacter sp.]